MHTYIYMYVHTYIYIYTRAYNHIYIFKYTYGCVCMYVTLTDKDGCVCMYVTLTDKVNSCVCFADMTCRTENSIPPISSKIEHIYVHIYIYIYVYTYVYIYIYIHIYLTVSNQNLLISSETEHSETPVLAYKFKWRIRSDLNVHRGFECASEFWSLAFFFEDGG